VNLVLIGLMGVGKTTVGRHLAGRLGRPFLDTDSIVEEACCRTVSGVFEQFGEAAFRRMEKSAVESVSRKSDCVIATGGGVVLDPQNIARLKERGILIHLDLDPETILNRIGRDTARPLIRNQGALASLYDARLPLYRLHADISVDRKEMDVDQTVREILKRIEFHSILPLRIAGEGWEET